MYEEEELSYPERPSSRKEGKEKEVVSVNINQFSIFAPKSSRVLYEDYPELRVYKQLKGLNTYELLFVWYYACEASPLHRITDKRKRCDEAMKITFFAGKQARLDQRLKEQYLNGKFTERIANAIDVMSRFKIGPRIRAKMITEKAFENIEKILDIDANNPAHFLNKDGEVDYSKKKSYVDTAAKAVELLPTLIEQLEGSFGVVSKKEAEQLDEGVDGESFMDSFHEQKD